MKIQWTSLFIGAAAALALSYFLGRRRTAAT